MEAALWISVLRFSDKSEPFGYVLCDSPLLLSCVKYQYLRTSYYLTIKYKHIPDVFLCTQHISILKGRKTIAVRQNLSAYSLSRIWLIIHGLSANEQYFNIIPNQPIIILSAMAYKLNQSKQTGHIFPSVGPIHHLD